MKTIIIATVLMYAVAFGQTTTLNLYEYQLQANSGMKMKSGKIGFISVKPAKNVKEDSVFGYWFSNNTNANAVFLEVKDGQKTIASVTAKEFSSKAKMQSAGSKTSVVYTAGSGAASVTVTIDADVVPDLTMPLGRTVQVDVKAKTAAGKNVSAVMTLFADGFVKKVGTNGVSNSRVEKGKATYPLVLLMGNTGTTVTTDNAEQKAAGKIVRVSSLPVVSTGNEVVLMSFRTQATSVMSYEKSVDQAVNLEQAITAKKERTELSLLNSASKATPFPGDTITYTIAYHNIGTSAAQDIVISNPIPANTFYVEQSAQGDGAEVTVDRKKVNPPQVGEVTSVSWKITKKVSPGEEGTVSLKAVVR